MKLKFETLFRSYKLILNVILPKKHGKFFLANILRIIVSSN